jgi:hypothetical protein
MNKKSVTTATTISVLAILYREGTPEKNCGKCAYFRKLFRGNSNICVMWQEQETRESWWCAYGSMKSDGNAVK